MDNRAFARAAFVNAIRGPVMLIAVGILFALHYSAGINIGKTWPILLIVAGVLHLAARIETGPRRPAGNAPAGTPQS